MGVIQSNSVYPIWVKVTAANGLSGKFDSTRIINMNNVEELVPHIEGGTTINFPNESSLTVKEHWREILDHMYHEI